MKPLALQLFIAVVLLWCAFLARVHQIETLPPFNDESHHIRRAEVVWSGENPDISFTLGKLLTYYWLGIFETDRLNAIWMARTVTGLFALLGLAGTYAVAKRLFGGMAALLSLYLLSFAPFMVFFDRMALTDPITAALGILTVWASLIFFDRPQEWEWGVGAGLMATLTILAKLTGLPFALMPLWALIALGSGSLKNRLLPYWRGLLACYGTIGALLLPFVLRIVYKELSGDRISVVDTHLINTQSPAETVAANLRQAWEAFSVYSSPPFLVAGLLAISLAILWRPRRMLFPLGALALPLGFTLFVGGVLSNRYLQLSLPLAAVLLGGAWVILGDKLSRARPWMLGYALTSLWILSFCQAFIINLWTQPLGNHYPNRDRWEYFINFTAGYGLMEAAALMPQLDPSPANGRVQVLGLVGSCHQLRLYLDEAGPVDLRCLEFGWSGELMGQVAMEVEQARQEYGRVYLLVEPQLPYTDLSQIQGGHQVEGRFPRPHGGMVVELWRLDPPPD
jgi:4-amino-4-deoxy-L-arabinose transferase-like glycosyltransferase